jgi:molybdopterin molybdotransferase
MISYAQAIEIVEKADTLPVKTLSVDQAFGHVCARDVISPAQVPPFRNSAMDGFAIIANQVPSAPVIMDVVGRTAAGDSPASASGGGAWEIMTGGSLPSGYDTVVRLEQVSYLNADSPGIPTRIRLNEIPKLGSNIRHPGEDFDIGDVLLEKGTLISAKDLMALSAAGISKVEAFSKPRITVVSTGNEIINDTAQALKPGQIYNSNGPYLTNALSADGIESQFLGTFSDDSRGFEKELPDAIKHADIILSTGGVSVGRFDFIPESLRRMGAEILFHGVSIRPGKPILYARFPNGTHYLGLSGNPISAALGLRFFGVPLLRALTGLEPEKPLTAKLKNSHFKSHPHRFFAKALAAQSKNGLEVQILKGQQSFKMKSFLEANCWAIIKEDQLELDSEETVSIYPQTADQWQF